MRVFVAGATGAIGRYLVPALVAAGHQVSGTTRSPGKAGQLTKAAEPEVIIHQMTDLTRLRNFRSFDFPVLVKEAAYHAAA
jgi:2-alkyl-3-oxoalkanoate reductase